MQFWIEKSNIVVNVKPSGEFTLKTQFNGGILIYIGIEIVDGIK